ncbi:hypothetical protein [Mucilaginibacter ginkgonis]|uniref:SD-repeat containing protein B domain-containing protein n=1 Tax=Mucilaginibacter ginkgonis TaxID=2682091 RepID=A0A6I4IPI3_9SPHI|nr:hypothetical protein [Mucilaginibacter ginkgonis]QQL49131.1 hypothetical protein GO620_013225 [Mucilaginibacter ginkgonis]
MFARDRRYRNFLFQTKAFAALIAVLLFFLPDAKAQIQSDYDEVPVAFNVQNVDNTQLNILVKDEKAYLPVSYVFDFLKIKNVPSADRDSLTGFFLSEADTYNIDRLHSVINYKGKPFPVVEGGLFKSAGMLYLESSYFGKVFALNCNFNFRNLTINVNTELELPVMREMRLNNSRANALKVGVATRADTVVKRTYPAFKFGMADWSVINSQETNLGNTSRAYLGLGAVVAGGETNLNLNYSTVDHFDKRNQFYSWRLANNDNAALRQIVAGKVYATSISSIYAPILGVTLTNTPTTFRRAYGTYTLTNTTFPNWMVELYVNNVLVSFVRTDAAGLYTFQVPLVYGSSQIKLRFYGPSGEERYTEQNITIPYTFLPKKEFEYNVTSGVVDDGTNAKFARLTTGYGLSSRVTVGAGAEYTSANTTGIILDSLKTKNNGNFIPFANVSARVFKNLLVSGEYDYNVRTRLVATYNLLSGLQIEYNDTWYKQGQTAIANTFLEERKAIVSIPLRSRSFAAFTRFTFDQILLPGSYYATADWLISASAGKFLASVNTYGVLVKSSAPYLYSNFAFTLTLFRQYLFTQQVQVEYRNRRIVNFKDQIERRLWRNGYMNFSIENDLNANLPTVELGFRYDLPFAQTSASVRANKAFTRYTQSANGSMIYDGKSGYTGFKNYTNVGKGALNVIAFLDLNENGKKDPGEPRASGIKLKLNSGRVEINTRDTSVRITDLEPYINYLLEIDPLSFESIAWRLKKHNFSVAVDPNQTKEIDVPVTISSEVSGRVSFIEDGEDRGVGRAIVGFYNNAGKLVARTTTEQDGYFSYMGLSPGDYYAKIDPDQLKEINFESTPEKLDFHIRRTVEGDTVDNLAFLLRELPKKTKPAKP